MTLEVILPKKCFLSAVGRDLWGYLEGLANSENMLKYLDCRATSIWSRTEKSESSD